MGQFPGRPLPTERRVCEAGWSKDSIKHWDGDVIREGGLLGENSHGCPRFCVVLSRATGCIFLTLFSKMSITQRSIFKRICVAAEPHLHLERRLFRPSIKTTPPWGQCSGNLLPTLKLGPQLRTPLLSCGPGVRRCPLYSPCRNPGLGTTANADVLASLITVDSKLSSVIGFRYLLTL